MDYDKFIEAAAAGDGERVCSLVGPPSGWVFRPHYRNWHQYDATQRWARGVTAADAARHYRPRSTNDPSIITIDAREAWASALKESAVREIRRRHVADGKWKASDGDDEVCSDDIKMLHDYVSIVYDRDDQAYPYRVGWR